MSKKFKRLIKNGKLDVVSELIGGPGDGMLVSDKCDKIYLPKQRRPVDELINYGDAPIMKLPDFNYHVYLRISKEKLIYMGGE